MSVFYLLFNANVCVLEFNIFLAYAVITYKFLHISALLTVNLNFSQLFQLGTSQFCINFYKKKLA